MRVTRLASAGAVVATLLLGASTIALSQNETVDQGPRYLYGEFEGFLHPDPKNPFECGVGFTSDSTLFGEIEPLGASTLRQVNCYVPTDTLGNVQDVVWTITGESGDILSAVGVESGDCIPDDVPDAGGFYSCWGSMAVTGGTGAFEGASGEIHVLAYTWNTQSDHPDAAPGDTPAMMIVEGLLEY